MAPIVDHLPLVIEVDLLGEGVGVDFRFVDLLNLFCVFYFILFIYLFFLLIFACRGQATAIQTTSSDTLESPVFQNLGGKGKNNRESIN